MGKMIENYSLQSELGRGMYSTVYKAINIKTKQEVAIKMVKSDKFKQYPKLEEGTYNEINILSNLESCPYIIKYYDMLKTVNHFYFVYEYCNGGTLEDLIKEKKPLPEKLALNYFSQMIEAFKVLSKHNIMHRDLKPQNLLLHDGIIKLADFGFCKPLENQDQVSRTMLGSPIYMAPQVLKGESYTIKADIWSLGVVLFKMMYGVCPFESNNIGKLIMLIEEEELKIPSEPAISPEVIKLIRRMIVKNAKMRADWSEVFSYEVKNGELFKQSTYKESSRQTNKDPHMKSSFTPSEISTTFTTLGKPQYSPYTPNSTAYSARQNRSGVMQIQDKKADQLFYNPKEIEKDYLRSTYSMKSPFRENLKKDLLLKNHQKCIEVMSLAISLAESEPLEATALAYLLTKHVERDLQTILESARKQAEVRNGDELIMKNFYNMLIDQQIQLKSLMNLLKENIRAETDITVELIEMKKKELLKKLVRNINRNKMEELVLALRIIDYVQEETLVRKETFEKLSKEKLLSNILVKMDELA